MKKFYVPVMYKVKADFIVEAESYEEAVKKVEDCEPPYDTSPHKCPRNLARNIVEIEDTFEIDKKTLADYQAIVEPLMDFFGM